MSTFCPHCSTKNQDDTFFCSECAAPLPSDKKSKIASSDSHSLERRLTRGTVFAQRYEVVEEIGSGNTGHVYRVLDSTAGEDVALKVILRDLSDQGLPLDHINRELKIAQNISHKNIARLYDFGEERGIPFITMEYVPGEHLKNMITMTKQFSTSTALHIAKQIGEGLAEAHRAGLLHHDLKPDNIRIDRDGHAKIMEFGIVQTLKDQKETTEESLSAGLVYSSPEKLGGNPVDVRSDIYSLGVILFELLTGSVPFKGDSAAEIMTMQKTEGPPDPRAWNSQIPFEVSRLVLKCLSTTKDERYENADLLVSELESLEIFFRTVDHQTPRPEETQKDKQPVAFPKRRAYLMALAVLIIGTLASLILMERNPPAPEAIKKMLVVLPFVNLGEPEDEYFAEGLTEEITTRLSYLDGLGIISRISAKQYKNSDKTARQIGRELGVDYVLEGTIRWDRNEEGQNRILIMPQLIRVADETQIWTERYDQVIEDLLSLQFGIAEKVIQQLDLVVLEPERIALMNNPTTNIDAYDYYLQGRQQAGIAWNTSNLADYDLAIELLERAIELDPEFAIAYVTMSITHQWAYSNGVDHSEERLEMARTAVYKAIEIDPDLPDAQLALGFYYYRGYQDYDRALEIFEEVRKVRPNMPFSYLGYILRRQGRWSESTTILEESFQLNPLNDDLAYQIGRSYVCMRRYNEAELWFDRAISINPNYYFPHLAKTRLPVLARGGLEEAHAQLLELPDLHLTDYTWYIHGLLEKNYSDVIQRLQNLPYGVFVGNSFYVPREMALASVYFLMKDSENTRISAESALHVIEEQIQKNPQDPRFRSSLGLVFAYLNRKDEAVREGLRSVEMLPLSKDAFDGPRYVLNMALIYTIVGEYESAIELLERLMSIEAGSILSSSLLRIDPAWDPLRDIPRFQKLLEQGH